jgi:hypothetical protein
MAYDRVYCMALAYLVSLSPDVNSKKIDPGSFFQFRVPLGRTLR